MVFIEELLSNTCIQDKINKYLDFEDMGVYFASKKMTQALCKWDLEKKRKAYEDKMMKPSNVKGPIKWVTKRILDHILSLDDFLDIAEYVRWLRMEYKGYDMREFYLKLIEKNDIVLGLLSSHSVWYIYELYYAAIYIDPSNIRYVTVANYSHRCISDLVDMACRADPLNLQYVEDVKIDGIEYIYLECVLRNPDSFQYIKNHYVSNIDEIYHAYLEQMNWDISEIQRHDVKTIAEIYKRSVSVNGTNLANVKNHSIPNISEIYEIAIDQNGGNLEWVQNHYYPGIENLYRKALASNGNSLRYVKRHDLDCIEELYLIAFNQNKFSICYITRTDLPIVKRLYCDFLINGGSLYDIPDHYIDGIGEVYKTAMFSDAPNNFRFIKRHDIPEIGDVYLAGVQNGGFLRCVENHFLENIGEIYINAIRCMGGRQLASVKNHSVSNINEIYIEAICSYAKSIQYIPPCNRTKELGLMALERDGTALKYFDQYMNPDLKIYYETALRQTARAYKYIDYRDVINIRQIYLSMDANWQHIFKVCVEGTYDESEVSEIEELIPEMHIDHDMIY